MEDWGVVAMQRLSVIRYRLLVMRERFMGCGYCLGRGESVEHRMQNVEWGAGVGGRTEDPRSQGEGRPNIEWRTSNVE